MVEWNETEGAVKRTYQGFRKRSSGVVQFDTAKSRFLAAGDNFSVKFWDMDNVELLTTADADGGLTVSVIQIMSSLNIVSRRVMGSFSNICHRQAHEFASTRKAL